MGNFDLKLGFSSFNLRMPRTSKTSLQNKAATSKVQNAKISKLQILWRKAKTKPAALGGQRQIIHVVHRIPSLLYMQVKSVYGSNVLQNSLSPHVFVIIPLPNSQKFCPQLLIGGRVYSSCSRLCFYCGRIASCCFTCLWDKWTNLRGQQRLSS